MTHMAFAGPGYTPKFAREGFLDEVHLGVARESW